MTNITHAGAPVRAYKAEGTPTNDVPLEPDHELPTLQPYKPSVGGWIGTGVGALAGAAVGGAVGGIAGIALEMGSSGLGGGNTAMWALGGAALLGLVVGGIATYTMNENSYEKRESAKIQSEYGTSTLGFARDMLGKFDHNTNGKIDLVNSTGLASKDERVYTETREQSRTTRNYDIINDEWDRDTQRWTETRGVSAAPVWEVADGDPKDQVVSDVELATLMSKFDTDRNGALTTSEQDAFKQAHAVIVEGWRA